MPRVSTKTYWLISAVVFFGFAYRLLWREFGPWGCTGGFAPALNLPGFEAPPVGHVEFHQSLSVRALYTIPYIAYALAATSAASAAIRFARAYRLGSIALGAVSAPSLMAPWVLHWIICLALPADAKGCFTWGDPLSLAVFFFPMIAPMTAMVVVLAKAEQWLARPGQP